MTGETDQIYTLMKAFFEQNVPYAKHTGIELLVIADGHGVAQLPDVHETQNHMGSQHAGALFTLAEAASGAASVSLFADKIAMVRAAIIEAKINYKKSARGVIKALKMKLHTMKNEELDYQAKKMSDFNPEQADVISERIIQKITKQFANHLKGSNGYANESLELIQKVFQLEVNPNE